MKRVATLHFSTLPLGSNVKKGYHYIGPGDTDSDQKEPHPKYTIAVNDSDHFSVPENNQLAMKLIHPERVYGHIKVEIKHGLSKETLPTFKYTSNYNSEFTHEFTGDAKYSVRFKDILITLEKVVISHSGFYVPPISQGCGNESALASLHFDTSRDVETFSVQLQRMNIERREKGIGTLHIAHITEMCKTTFYSNNQAENTIRYTVFYCQRI